MKRTKRFALSCRKLLAGMVIGAGLISYVHLFTIALRLVVGMMITGFLLSL